MSWTSVLLGEIADKIDYGVTASASYDAKGPKFLRITDIQDSGVEWSTVPRCIAPKNKLANARLADGDIVFARTGATTGKSFLVAAPPDESVFASYLIRVRPSKAVYSSYLAHFFDSSDYWRQIKAKAQGAAQDGVNASKLATLEIPLPPLEEQRRIAAILDKAAALRQKRKKAINLLDSLTQSIFLEMFGDPFENERNLPVCALEDLVDPERKITYGILMPGPDESDGVPYVRVVDLKGGVVLSNQLRRTSKKIAGEYRRSTLRSGDLLISIRGHVGRMAITPPECDGANITQDTARLAITKASAAYIMALLGVGSSQHWMNQRTKGVAVRGINLGDLKKFPVMLAPVREQTSFAERTEAINKLTKAMVEQLACSERLFSSLQHRAFTGQL